MAAPKWDLTCPPFIDPRVWAVAIKRRKSRWNLGYYLFLMTVEPTEADVTLRAFNSKMNKDYGEFPAGLVEAKSVLDVIQQRSDNLGIPYNQAKQDVYDAIEWVVCDMPTAYGSSVSNVHEPMARIQDLYAKYPQMAWCFWIDLFLSLIKKADERSYEASKVVLYGVQSAILSHLEDRRWAVPVFRGYRSYSGIPVVDPSNTLGSSLWMTDHEYYRENDIDAATSQISSAVDPRAIYGNMDSVWYTLRLLCGGLLTAESGAFQISRGIEMLASIAIDPAALGDPIPGYQFEFTSLYFNPFCVGKFRDFIRRWPPSAPSGAMPRPHAPAALIGSMGVVLGAAAMRLLRSR